MREIDEVKIYVEELRQTGHLILTYTDRKDNLYILRYDDKRFDLDPVAQLEAQVFILNEALANLDRLPKLTDEIAILEALANDPGSY